MSQKLILFSFIFKLKESLGCKPGIYQPNAKRSDALGLMMRMLNKCPVRAIYLFQYIMLGLQPENLFYSRTPRLHLGLIYISLTGCTFNL